VLEWHVNKGQRHGDALGAKEVPENQNAYRAWLYQMARDGAIDGHRRHMLSETVEPDQINPWTAGRSPVNTIAVRQALMRISDGQRRTLLLVDERVQKRGDRVTASGIFGGTP
jgi:DNA-directed RNA polymerase specialized sigma24 family protein